MFLQDGYAGSWSGGYGLIAIIAGGFYIIAAFAGAALLKNVEHTSKVALPAEVVPEAYSVSLSSGRSSETGSFVLRDLSVSRTVQLPETHQLLESYS